MDYSDIDADRQVEPLGRSRSPSRTPRADERERSRSPAPYRERSRSRSRTPRRYEGRDRSREAPRYTPPPKPKGVPDEIPPSAVVGVFGLSIRTVESDLEYEFGRIAPVEKVVVVYDARSGRSRGFGFITMKDADGAAEVIKALNGKDLHGRRIRVDFSTTRRPHDPTPGIYKGEPRPDERSYGRESRYPPPPRGGDSYRRGGDTYVPRAPLRGGDSYSRGGDSYSRGGDSYRGGEDSYRRGDRDDRDRARSRYTPADQADDWRTRRDRRSNSPGARPRRNYTRSPSPPRRDRYEREERVPPPPRSRQASHLDSPPREQADLEPSY